MNKKIIAIFALLILVTSISAVSALDLGSLIGQGEKSKVNVGGIDFNVPSGFKEDSTNTTNKTVASLEKLGLNVSGKTYTKDSTILGFMVANFTGKGLNSTNILNVSDGNKTTINNVTGYMAEDQESSMFSYIKNGCGTVLFHTEK